MFFSVHQISSWHPQRSEEGVRHCGTGVIDSMSVTMRMLGIKPWSLKEQSMFLSSKPPGKYFFFTSVLYTIYLDMMLLHRTVWASMLQVQENQRLSDSLYCGTGFDMVSGTEPTLSPASEENSGHTARSRHSWAEVSRSFQAISNVCKLLHTWDAHGNDGWKSRRTAPLAIMSQFSGHWEASSFYQSDCPSPGHNTAIKHQWYFVYLLLQLCSLGWNTDMLHAYLEVMCLERIIGRIKFPGIPESKAKTIRAGLYHDLPRTAALGENRLAF